MTSTGNHESTWVHEIFQGILTSETRCLNCETVRIEHFFLKLSLWVGYMCLRDSAFIFFLMIQFFIKLLEVMQFFQRSARNESWENNLFFKSP
jgi:hypothetical protein